MTTEKWAPLRPDYRCPRGGRRVKRPGFGPVCATKVAKERAEENDEAKDNL